ncbi:hypothetical protein [Pseudoxanthomonas kalamensis]|uniref:hypothetical protein n=1 Tax=Pseudoxanthomonas kalamensis TaxID=289483 RepID=UPI0013907BB4|nr:hypothetical protein [Pseudoxanthomonas kalamensis]
MSSSLKPLKSVAHNVCHQFASTLNYWAGDYGINHFARSVVAAGNLVAVDLLAGTSHPTLAGEGAAGARQLAAALPSLLVKEGFEPNLLASATATYHVRGPLPEPGGNVAYDCRVEFTTVGGRSYAVDLSELNAP